MAGRGRSRRVVDTMKGVGKGLLLAAKEDLTANSQGLKQDFKDLVDIAKSKRRAARVAKITAIMDLSVNPDAGGEVLTQYKEEWAAIHTRTDKSSLEAEKMDENLHSIEDQFSRAHAIISSSCNEFSTLPEVVKAVETSAEKVSEIGKTLREVEESIIEYSQVTAQLENERKKHSLKIQFRRQSDKGEEERRRLERILQEEQRLTTEMETAIASQKVHDRQKTFQDMFDQQMADYREKGEVERPIGVDERERSGSHLEDVIIEDSDGTASLNEFLSDVVVDNTGSHDQQDQSQDQQGESHDQKDESHDQQDEPHDQQGSHDQKDESHDQQDELGDRQDASHDHNDEAERSGGEEDDFQDCN